jgi:hypothetical protein
MLNSFGHRHLDTVREASFIAEALTNPTRYR